MRHVFTFALLLGIAAFATGAHAAHKAPATIEITEPTPPDGHITSEMCSQILPGSGSVALAEVIASFLKAHDEGSSAVTDNHYWLLQGDALAMAAVVEEDQDQPRPDKFSGPEFDAKGWFMTTSSAQGKEGALLVGTLESGCSMAMLFGGEKFFQEWSDHIGATWLEVELAPSPETDYYIELHAADDEAMLGDSSAVLPGGSDGEIEGNGGIDGTEEGWQKRPPQFCEVCDRLEPDHHHI